MIKIKKRNKEIKKITNSKNDFKQIKQETKWLAKKKTSQSAIRA